MLQSISRIFRNRVEGNLSKILSYRKLTCGVEAAPNVAHDTCERCFSVHAAHKAPTTTAGDDHCKLVPSFALVYWNMRSSRE